MKKIVVFGATGNVGAYFTDYCKEYLNPEEYKVIAVGRKKTVYFDNAGIEYKRVDICDKKDFEKYNISTNAFLQKKLDYKFNGKKDFIPKKATIEYAKIIAGNGSNTELRARYRLAEKYGGNAEEWSKCVGKIESDKYIFDVHWYELKGKQYAAKVKSRTEKKESKKGG